MAFAIMRTAKLSSAGSIGGLNNHLERKMEVPNADQQLQGYNSRPVGSGDLWADINTRLQQAGIDKVRANGVYGVEFLLTASPEAFNYQKTVDASGKVGLRGNVELWKNFEARSKEWLEENFGKVNLVNFTVHKDEQTPHIHAVIVPITQGKKGNKLSARDVIGGDRSRLAQLQDS
ncbi:mobilization protein, partial [Siphonobacter sp. BAB-5385]|uniref:MobV family relaxase n=1 Tax=Siphonobacter sp. BAB-5385 TaxID=1864822 RepID=UPI000BDDEB7C